MTHAGHRAYKKVDQRNRPCDLGGSLHPLSQCQFSKRIVIVSQSIGYSKT